MAGEEYRDGATRRRIRGEVSERLTDARERRLAIGEDRHVCIGVTAVRRRLQRIGGIVRIVKDGLGQAPYCLIVCNADYERPGLVELHARLHNQRVPFQARNRASPASMLRLVFWG